MKEGFCIGKRRRRRIFLFGKCHHKHSS